MKAASFIAILIAILCCNHLFGMDDGKEPFRIRPIQILSRAEVPKDLPLEMRPGGLDTILHGGVDCEPGLIPGPPLVPIAPNDDDFFYPVGFQIWYLIEGRDIVCFDSITIDSISTPEGRDISRFPSGKRSYTAGSNHKPTEDGKYCVCSLFVKQNHFGKVEQLSIKGHATVLTATEREEKTFELGMPTGKTGKAGPFTVEVKPGRSPCAGYSASELLNIDILGPIRQLVTLKVTEGDKDIRQLSTWGETGEDVTVLKPKSGKFTLKLRYAAKLKPVKVALGKVASEAGADSTHPPQK